MYQTSVYSSLNILFLIYINDYPEYLSLSRLRLFADSIITQYLDILSSEIEKILCKICILFYLAK
jgi:hypothetical protein